MVEQDVENGFVPVAKRQYKGQAYFVRHGESTANERNVFAGLHDVYLTPFGQLQAKRAGQDIKKRGLNFDAVYVSYMRRARQTCQLALEESNPGTAIKPVIDYRLAERSFGVFAGQNQNLLKQVYGYHEYEHLLHSPNEGPPSSEPVASIYARVSAFFEDTVVPYLERGENVLVVAHQYVLEPLALYLNGLRPEDYQTLNLPNGKALSIDQLRGWQKSETGLYAKNIKIIGDYSILHGLKAIPWFVLASIALKFLLEDRIPLPVFITILCLLLALSTYYTYLEVNVGASYKAIPGRMILIFVLSWVIRLAVTVPLSILVLPPSTFIWGIFFIVPPALTASTLSLLWGGGKYLAVIGALLLSLIIPPGLVGMSFAPNVLFKATDLSLFYAVLGGGLIVPAIMAQWYRSSSPVECAKHAKQYKFLAMWALLGLAFVAVYQVTPTDIFMELFNPMDDMASSVSGSLAFWQTLSVFAAMKGSAAVLRSILIRQLGVHHEHATDLYVLLTNPNIFLWLGLANAVDEPDISHLRFWAVLFFFLLPTVEQFIFTHAFMRRMAAMTIKTSRVSLSQLQEVWNRVSPGGDSLDIEGVKKFVFYVQNATTGFTDNVPDYVAQQLMKAVDLDGNGFVEKGELFTYVSNVGLVIELNGQPTMAGTEIARHNSIADVQPAHLSKGARAIADRFVNTLTGRDRLDSVPLNRGMPPSDSGLADVPLSVLNAQGKWAKAAVLALGGRKEKEGDVTPFQDPFEGPERDAATANTAASDALRRRGSQAITPRGAVTPTL